MEKLIKKKNFLFQGYKLSLEELLHTSVDEVDIKDFLDTRVSTKLAKREKIVIGDTVTNEHAECYIARKLRTSNNYVIPDEKINTAAEYFNKKVILISGSTGTGKSTVLGNLATAIKNTHPHLWVLRINLSDYTDVLEQLHSNTKSFTIDDFLEAKHTLKTNFEKQLFSVPNKVLLIIDGINEVFPDYEELILNFLQYCEGKHNFYKIFLASHVNAHRNIETIFFKREEIIRIELDPLSVEDQISFLTKYWVQTLELCDDIGKTKCTFYAKELIAEKWIDEKNEDVGVPLQIRMLAEVFEDSKHFKDNVMTKWEGCRDFLTSNNSKPLIPKKPDVVELCQLFIHKHIVKNIEDNERNLMRSRIKEINKAYNYYLYVLALETTLVKTQCEYFTCYSSKPKNIPKNLKNSRLLKIVDGKLRFIHRIFAEYFLAECILDHLNSASEAVLIFFTNILCSRLFPSVRLFFGKFLENDLNSLKHESLKFIGRVLRQNNLNPYVEIPVPRGSLGFLDFILKCFELDSTPIDLDYARRCNEPALHQAVKRKQLNEVVFLIEKGALIDSRNNEDQSALIVSANRCSLDIVQCLVKHGADVKCKDAYGKTPLHVAAQEGTLDIVEYLIKQGGDIHSRDRNSCTPLILAAESGALDVVKFILNKGAGLNFKGTKGSALFYAIENDHVDVAKYLIQKGADVTLTNCCRDTLLQITCSRSVKRCPEQVEIAELLIKKGVDINSTNINRQTALHKAIDERDRVTLVEFLVENGADINRLDYCNYTPVDLATKHGAFKILEYLTERRAESVSRHDALEEAAKRGYEDVIEYLVENLEDLDIACNDCNADLVTMSIEHPEVTKVLLEYEATSVNTDTLNAAIGTASINTIKALMKHGAYETNETIQKAASSGYLNVVKLLVDVSDGIEAIKDVGNNLEVLKYLKTKRVAVNKMEIFHMAASSGNVSIIKFLIEEGIDINEEDGGGSTALHKACRNNRFHAVKYLVKHGAEVNLTDYIQRTALHMCTMKGYFDIAKFLIENGADVNCECRGITPILQAVTIDDFNMLKLFTENGARSEPDYSGFIMLSKCLITGHLEMLTYILTKYPNFKANARSFVTYFIENVAESDYFHVYMDGILETRYNLVKYLQEEEENMPVNISKKNAQMIFLGSVIKGDMETIRYLLNKGVDVNVPDTDNYPLHETTDICVAKLLLHSGANVNAKTKSGCTALHKAAERKNFDICRLLVEAGADVNATDEFGNTPIYEAASSGSYSKVKYLVDKGATVSRTNRGRTELDKTVKTGDLDTIKFLVRNGVDVNATDYLGRTVLYGAVMQRNLDMVKLLVEMGARIYFENDQAGFDILCCAVAERDLDIVKYFIKKGVKVNVKDSEGNTALNKAIDNRDCDMVRFLVASGAYVNVTDDMDYPPLQLAAIRGDLYITKILVENGADINVKDENDRTVLYDAVENNHLYVLKYLLEQGIDVNAITKTDTTLLRTAIVKLDYPMDIIEVLLKHRVDVNAVDKLGCFALQLAAEFSDSDIIEILITHGANLNTTSGDRREFLLNELCSKAYFGIRRGRKIRLIRFLVNSGLDMKNVDTLLLLRCAVANEDFEVVEYLLERYLDVNSKMLFGHTVLHTAAQEDLDGMIAFLLLYGAEIDTKDENGCTPLHMAAIHNSLKAIKPLVGLGAKLDCKNKFGCTPLSSAIASGSYAVVKYLKEQRYD